MISRFVDRLNQFINVVRGLDRTKKIIIASVAFILVLALGIASNISLQRNKIVLFQDLATEDFSKITQELESLNYEFDTSGTSIITVLPDKRQEIITRLAQENLIPAGVQGWELFNVESFTETQFDKDIKKYRALKGAIEKSLMTLKSIDKAYVNIAIPEEEIFTTTSVPVKASVILHFASGIEKISRKETRGIVNLVSRAVSKLKPENVSIADASGKIISDFEEDLEKEKLELRLIQEKLRIQEEQRMRRLLDIRKTLRWLLGGEGRVDITRFEYDLNWDTETYKENQVSPVVAIEDNPNTPYSELQLVEGYSLKVSSKDTSEEFSGRGFTPDGPAGTEPNLPPGYKDTDYQKANYNKKENINNYEFNKRVSDVRKQKWKIEKVALSIVIDGTWTKTPNEEGNAYVREYTPVSADELKLIQRNLEAAIGFDNARGDKISVISIPKDRTKQFEEEDAELERQTLMRRTILISSIALIGLIALVLVYRAIQKEIARRRRLREEELLAEQQRLREAALLAGDEGGIEAELSPEEKLRQELLNNAINLANEKPDEVAKLLKTWLSEDDDS